MKILCHNVNQNPMVHGLAMALNCADNIVGFTASVNPQEVADFAPDLVIHNIDGVDAFPFYLKCVSININETKSPNSFSLTNKSSDQFIERFVCLHNNIEYDERYSSDVAYLGNPIVFGAGLARLTNSNLSFKCFNSQPINIPNYVGTVPFEKIPSVYAKAKASITLMSDHDRILDIVAFGGNPVAYTEDVEDFMERVHSAVCGERFSIPGYSQAKILDKDTSFDRASYMANVVGLSKLSQQILEKKKEIIKDI